MARATTIRRRRLICMVHRPSPTVDAISWGHMDIDGVGSGKDFKLWPGGGRQWNWRETGTEHLPGIQPTDVEELLEHGSEIVVLTRGMDLQLQTAPATLELLRTRGVAVHVEETNAAVKRYNELAEQGFAVGGLFHSTC
jgi:hypothetical protein